MLKFLLAALATSTVWGSGHKSSKLVRLIVLARHGNRAPNPQTKLLCPQYFKKVLPKFGVPPAALSAVGMAQNWENGEFLRDTYKEFLPEGSYQDDGTFSVMSERMTRNIVSTEALMEGLFPPGTGIKGFLHSRPNLVPIATTAKGVDQMLNCPRDGPCKPRYKADFTAWTGAHEAAIFKEHRELFHKVSEACGFELTPNGIAYEGKNKSLTWAAKSVADAFSFAAGEGIDPTIDGRISHEEIAAFKSVAGAMVKGSRFGAPHQLTYWVSDFLPTVLKLATKPKSAKEEQWLHEKLHLFLNHRELVYATAHILGLPIAFEGLPVDVLPPGCALVFEVHETADGHALRFMWWGPSAPEGQKLRAAVAEGSLASLYKYGHAVTTAPTGCKVGELCPLSHVKKLFAQWTNRTGTYQEVCGLTGGAWRADLLATRLASPVQAAAGSAGWAVAMLGMLAMGVAAWNFASKRPPPATRSDYQEI